MDWLFNIRKCRSRKNSKSDDDDELHAKKKNEDFFIVNLTKEKIRASVPAPVGVEIQEWLATNTLAFFSNIKLTYDILSEFCTVRKCNSIFTCATINFVWANSGKKAKLTAPEYIEIIIIQVEKYLLDEATFPTRYDLTFPENFLSIVKKIFRMLFHVLLHLYQSHYKDLCALDHIKTTNTILLHFTYFQQQHNLMAPTDIKMLEELTNKFINL